MSHEEQIERANNFNEMMKRYLNGEISEDVFNSYFDDFMSEPGTKLIFE